MLRRFLLFLARTLLIVGAVWLAVVVYWHVTRRVVSPADLIVYLVVLPLGVLLAYRVGAWAIGLGRTLRARRQQAASAQHTGQSTPGEPETDRAPVERPLHVLGSALVSGLGDAEAWLDRTRGYDIHHVLDRDLSDALGWPLRSIRVDDLDDSAVLPGRELADAMQPGARRTARMLERVLDALADVVGQVAASAAQAGRVDPARETRGVVVHPEWSGGRVPPSDVPPADARPRADDVSALAVHLLLPDFVTADDAELIGASCVIWAQQAGWPPDAANVSVMRGAEARAALQSLDEVVTRARQNPGELLVVLAAASWLDDTAIGDQLLRDPVWAERLRKSATVVGEAAAGLVIAHPPRPGCRPPEARAPLAQLSRLVVGERQKPVDVRGTVDAELLAALMQGLSRDCGVDAAQVRRVVATGDLGHNRPVELGKWLTEHLPHLSLVDDSIQVGQHLGECEPVSDLAALALAVESCRQDEAPVLYCSNHSPRWRGLSAILPVAHAA